LPGLRRGEEASRSPLHRFNKRPGKETCRGVFVCTLCPGLFRRLRGVG